MVVKYIDKKEKFCFNLLMNNEELIRELVTSLIDVVEDNTNLLRCYNLEREAEGWDEESETDTVTKARELLDRINADPQIRSIL